jgi:hypothetical protein
MKSTFFNKPLEFSINIDGDNWKQGDTISGNVSISSHEGSDIDFANYGIFLCNGNAKKIKAGDPKGLEIVEKLIFAESESNDFSFSLDINSPITEKSTGPYIVCSKIDDLLQGQHLVMQVTANDNTSKIIEILENFLRFKVKSVKSKKSDLEYTLKVPAAKEYSSISSFKLLINFESKTLNLKYQFKTKKIVFEAGNTTTKDELKTLNYTLEANDYLFYGESIDQDKMLKHFNEVLDQVKLRPLI